MFYEKPKLLLLNTHFYNILYKTNCQRFWTFLDKSEMKNSFLINKNKLKNKIVGDITKYVTRTDEQGFKSSWQKPTDMISDNAFLSQKFYDQFYDTAIISQKIVIFKH